MKKLLSIFAIVAIFWACTEEQNPAARVDETSPLVGKWRAKWESNEILDNTGERIHYSKSDITPNTWVYDYASDGKIYLKEIIGGVSDNDFVFNGDTYTIKSDSLVSLFQDGVLVSNEAKLYYFKVENELMNWNEQYEYSSWTDPESGQIYSNVTKNRIIGYQSEK